MLPLGQPSQRLGLLALIWSGFLPITTTKRQPKPGPLRVHFLLLLEREFCGIAAVTGLYEFSNRALTLSFLLVTSPQVLH